MIRKIRVVIVNDNKDSIASVKKLLETYSDLKITGEAMDGISAVDIAINYQPDIVLMDINMPLMDGFNAAMEITRVAPYIGIILVGVAESIDVVRRAMQCGADDFLTLPLTGSKLKDSIYSLYEIKQQQKKHMMKNPMIVPIRQSKVVTVFSSKGGVGKTVLATNIAVALRELTREDVLLMDFDLQFGDVSDLLNIRAKSSIIDLIADKENIDVSELNNYLSSHHSGIKVLPAPGQAEQADLVNEDNIKEIINLFLKSFDYIVVDLSPLFNGVTLSSINMSDSLILVANMEIPTLKNVKESIEILQKMEFSQDKITLVLNRFNESSEITVDYIKKFLGTNELFCVDDNPQLVSAAINTGEPLVLRNKDTQIAKQIIAVSNSLIEYKRDLNKKEKQSFFQKIFGKWRIE